MISRRICDLSAIYAINRNSKRLIIPQRFKQILHTCKRRNVGFSHFADFLSSRFIIISDVLISGDIPIESDSKIFPIERDSKIVSEGA